MMVEVAKESNKRRQVGNPTLDAEAYAKASPFDQSHKGLCPVQLGETKFIFPASFGNKKT